MTIGVRTNLTQSTDSLNRSEGPDRSGEPDPAEENHGAASRPAQELLHPCAGDRAVRGHRQAAEAQRREPEAGF
jgi:hypothetical protein